LCQLRFVGQNEFMETTQIEGAILIAARDRWTKVAMVIAKVAKSTGSDLPTGHAGYEVISEHIEGLIRAGRLEAQGDTKNWRFSEVRRSCSKASDQGQ